MPKVVFSYFPLKGLGECIRMLLAYGGQEFEDRRIPKEEWLQHKDKTPFGQMPLLEIDGKQYAQSAAIARYLGHKYGVAGKDIEEDFEIDQIVDFVTDIRMKLSKFAFESDAELKKKLQEEFQKDVAPALFTKINEIITKNNGHLALGRLTWADFYFTGLYDAIKHLSGMSDLDKEYPSFKKLQESVVTLPKVKEYVAQRPQTDY